MKIFCDVDEVLADFVGGMCRLQGVDRQPVDFHRTTQEWEITRPLGQLKYGREMTLKEFWNPVHNHPKGEKRWWADIPPLPWCGILYRALKKMDAEMILVTSPSRSYASHLGKYLWVQRWLGHDPGRVFITPHKHLLSAPGRLLIDDRPKNCQDWASEGGQGYLFPSGPPVEVNDKIERIIEEIALIVRLNS